MFSESYKIQSYTVTWLLAALIIKYPMSICAEVPLVAELCPHEVHPTEVCRSGSTEFSPITSLREVLKVMFNTPLTRSGGNTAIIFVPVPVRCTIWLILVDFPMTYHVVWSMILAPLGLVFNTVDLNRRGHASLDAAVVVRWNIQQSGSVLSGAV